MALIKKPNSNLKIVEVDISEIKVKRQGLRYEKEPADLIESIKEIGLINPPTINQSYELIAGGRRYAAIKALGWKKMPVIIYEATHEDRSIQQEELVHIDENLTRLDLTKIDFEKALAKRKRIYEYLHPETKQGGDRKSAKIKGQESSAESFVEDTAKKTGKSKSAIKDAVRRVERSSPALLAAREAGEINATQATELVKLGKEEQEIVIPHIKNKDTKEVKEFVSKVMKNGVDAVIGDAEFSFSEMSFFSDLKKAKEKLIAALRTDKILSSHYLKQEVEPHLSEIEKSIKEFRAAQQQMSLQVNDEA